ncbi:hypothetical protein LCGC14_1606780 [marine sediment metagenome]|uniref:Pyrrolo-quinoline quinone repeat domain-containing protein n=1 Tax=marine sediment metagenome TaxID=412755 RepID=A0A0F9I9W8_9ZZZZ
MSKSLLDRLSTPKANKAKGKKAKYGYQYTAVSAKDGAKAWSRTSDRPEGRFSEVYFASGLVWIQSPHDRKARKTEGFHNPGGGVSCRWEGLDPRSGEVSRSLLAPVTLVYRCHRLYATDRFLIGNRPVYFTDWTDGKVTRFEATLISCRSVAGLGQGMFFGLYTRSMRCMCIRPAISGVSAFASDGKTINGEVKTEAEGRLVKGPASPPASVAAPAEDDWPMYRHDMRRSAHTAGKIPAGKLVVLWNENPLPAPSGQAGTAPSGVLRNDWGLNKVFGDPVSQPTVAEGKVFVSLTHAQQVVAMDARTGREIWRFLAPARLDVSPTIHKGLCLVGCNDGWVYALRSDDGRLVWRFRAAPAARRMVAYGQVESAWPVTGGVLVAGDSAYVVAGRTTETDGGLYVHALTPATGEAIWSGRHVKPDDGPIGAWNLRGLRNAYFGPSDILCSDGRTVAISAHRAGRFACKSGRNISDRRYGGPRFGLMRSRYAADNQKTQYPPVAFAKGRSCSVLRVSDKKTKKYSRYIAMTGRPSWRTALPSGMQVEALAIAGDAVLAAISVKGPTSSRGVLWVLSAKDGEKLAMHKLPAAPAFEALSVAKGKVYLALQDGGVMRLGRK